MDKPTRSTGPALLQHDRSREGGGKGGGRDVLANPDVDLVVEVDLDVVGGEGKILGVRSSEVAHVEHLAVRRLAEEGVLLRGQLPNEIRRHLRRPGRVEEREAEMRAVRGGRRGDETTGGKQAGHRHRPDWHFRRERMQCSSNHARALSVRPSRVQASQAQCSHHRPPGEASKRGTGREPGGSPRETLRKRRAMAFAGRGSPGVGSVPSPPRKKQRKTRSTCALAPRDEQRHSDRAPSTALERLFPVRRRDRVTDEMGTEVCALQRPKLYPVFSSPFTFSCLVSRSLNSNSPREAEARHANENPARSKRQLSPPWPQKFFRRPRYGECFALLAGIQCHRVRFRLAVLLPSRCPLGTHYRR